MPAMLMKHKIEPKEKLLSEIGDLSKIDIFNNLVLVALYIRPNVTDSGIILTDKTVDEDIYQSKVGLIVKKGKTAFADDSGVWFAGEKFELGDWVVSRASDGWAITINKVACRIIEDVNIKGRTDHPDKIW